MCNKKAIALIVEDQQEVRYMWKLALAPLKMEILEANTLKDALAMSQRIPPPDLILLDLRLEDSNDVTTVNAIPHFKERNPDVVVIVISGYATPEIAEMAIQLGAHGIRAKMDMNRSAELWAEIQSAMQKAPANAQKALAYTAEIIASLTKALVL